MSLIVCQSCLKEYSSNLSKCPHCGHEENKVMKPCRICKTMLPADYHRFVQEYSTWGVSNGNSYSSTDYRFLHRSCTNCGESYPLQCMMDNSLMRGIVKLLLIFIGAIIGLVAFFFGGIIQSKLTLGDWFFWVNVASGLFVWLFLYISLRMKFVGY